MKKYNYKYCVYYNNMCAGVLFIAAFDSLQDALNKKHAIEYSPRGGCCDVVKKRIRAGAEQPINNSIYNNYKYSFYDLE
jgi:hypothetical protein